MKSFNVISIGIFEYDIKTSTRSDISDQSSSSFIFEILHCQSYTISEDHSMSAWFALIELCQDARSTVSRQWSIIVVVFFSEIVFVL